MKLKRKKSQELKHLDVPRLPVSMEIKYNLIFNIYLLMYLTNVYKPFEKPSPIITLKISELQPAFDISGHIKRSPLTGPVKVTL